MYLKTDICHLSDVFQKFSDFAYGAYNLDPRHSYTLPGFSWQSMIKMTKIELELIGGVQPHFCPWENCVFSHFSPWEKMGKKYMEREGNEYFSLFFHILLYPPPQLISDSKMYLFLMDTVRGGVCVVNKKHVKADNIYIRKVHDESSDKKVKKKLKTKDLNKFIMYFDANNLYGHSMSKPLPYKNFKWSDDLTLDLIQTCIYEVDVQIPKELIINSKIIH